MYASQQKNYPCELLLVGIVFYVNGSVCHGAGIEVGGQA